MPTMRMSIATTSLSGTLEDKLAAAAAARFTGVELAESDLITSSWLQTATVHTIDGRDMSTKDLPERWTFTDEWYNLVPFPSKVRFLALVDEATMTQGVRGSMGHPGHGGFHPVAWCQYYDGGRAWLTTLGHDARDFSTDGSFAGAQYFQRLILGGVESVMGKTPFCR
jgi:uncharacterized protein